MQKTVTTVKIPGGRYLDEASGKFVDCNGYSLDGEDKSREISSQIADLQAQLDNLQNIQRKVEV